MVKCPLQTSAAGADARLEGDSSWEIPSQKVAKYECSERDRLNEDARHTLGIRRRHVNIGPFYADPRNRLWQCSAVFHNVSYVISIHVIYDFSRIVIVILRMRIKGAQEIILQSTRISIVQIHVFVRVCCILWDAARRNQRN